jgi:hypothetical protein
MDSSLLADNGFEVSPLASSPLGESLVNRDAEWRREMPLPRRRNRLAESLQVSEFLHLG